jgi:O-acetylhomoserine (thiol)-lyase
MAFFIKEELFMRNYSDETLCIHGGYKAKAGEPQVLPIAQSTTFRYYDPEDLAKLFDLEKEGYIYSRIANPTVAAFEKKINALEGGVGAVAFASGQSALTAAVLTICSKGDHIIASSKIYGGSITLLTSTLKKFGIDVTLVNPKDSIEKISESVKRNTKIIFGEVISNPSLDVLDVEKFSKVAKMNGLIFMIDNTFTTPYLFKPFDYGANIVVHSASKYIDGHGIALAGVVIDGGNFNWENSNKFNELNEPDPSYHDLVFTEAFQEAAYITKVRVNALRDLGAALSPQNAFLLHNGLETLHLRMDKHSNNALCIANFLNNSKHVSQVNYPLLESHDTYTLGKKYLTKGASGVISFSLKGGKEKAMDFLKKIELISLVTHVGDLRTSVLHPATTTHRQLSEEKLIASGISDGMIRLSVGIENPDDIIEDLKNALRGD